MNNSNGTFTIKNNKGEELTCNVLFTFDSDEFKKSYIVFTDNTTDENGKIKVYANTYDPRKTVNFPWSGGATDYFKDRTTMY